MPVRARNAWRGRGRERTELSKPSACPGTGCTLGDTAHSLSAMPRTNETGGGGERDSGRGCRGKLIRFPQRAWRENRLTVCSHWASPQAAHQAPLSKSKNVHCHEVFGPRPGGGHASTKERDHAAKTAAAGWAVHTTCALPALPRPQCFHFGCKHQISLRGGKE